MTSKLDQLLFLFGSQDDSTNMGFSPHSTWLEIKKVTKPELVTRIAAKMDIGSKEVGSSIILSLATPLKETAPIPDTPFQKALKQLFEGSERVMGLSELLTFFYYESSLKHKTSKVEQSYIRSMGWKLDFERIGFGKIKNGNGPVEWVANGGCNDLMKNFLFELSELPIYTHYKDWRKLYCGFGKGFPNMMEYDHPDKCYRVNMLLRYKGERYRGTRYDFADLVRALYEHEFIFPNGEVITLIRRESEENGRRPMCSHNIYDYILKVEPPSTFRRWTHLMRFIKDDRDVVSVHQSGRLEEFIDVETCVCPPKEVYVSRKELRLIRDAVASYAFDGVYKGIGHAIVEDRLHIWLETHPMPSVYSGNYHTDWTPSRLRKAKSTFDMVVSTCFTKIKQSYPNEIKII